MLKTIIEKEFRDLLGSTKFIVTFAVCALLIVIAFYTGAARHRMYQSQYEAAQAERVRSIEGLTDWHDLGDTRVFIPPQPLASLVTGVSNDIERTATVGGRGGIGTEDSRYNEDPVFAIFRFIDLEFVFKIVLSLFAILLGYNAVSGEKERGTLRLSFANPLPRSTYILGKLIGNGVALSAAVLVAIGAGTLLYPLMGIQFSGQEWLRLLLVVGVGLLYFGVFLNLSIFVSASTKHTSSSFLVLLVIWLMCIHIVPGASVLLAARSVDVPSTDEISFQKATLSAQLADEFHEGMAAMDIGNVTAEMDITTLINSHMDSLSEDRDRKMQALASRLGEERKNAQQEQESLAFSLARISPATSLTLAASHLAGTSTQLKNQFAAEAKQFQGEYAAFMKEKTGLATGGGLVIRTTETTIDEHGNIVTTQGMGDREKPEQLDFKEIPGFKFTNASLSESVEPAIVDFGLLAIFNLLFFACAFVAFNRYDLR